MGAHAKPAGSRDGQASLPPVGAREIPAWVASIPVVALIAMLATVLLIMPQAYPGFKGTGHLPLILAAGVAGVLAWRFGFTWDDIHEGMIAGIQVALPALLILLVIGLLMGTWLAAGIVPAFIDWGLLLINPAVFLPATCLVCSVVSLVTGSSWSTAGTVGIALIGVGETLGIANAWTAGAVVSGAYMGDKLSPMSDTTNLAPAMAGTDLFTHIRHMLYTTIPAWSLAMVGYFVLGRTVAVADASDSGTIHALLVQHYAPSLIHLTVPILVGIMVWKKVPALPTLMVAALLGGALALVQGVGLDVVVASAVRGYEPTTGDEALDDLLRRGGLSRMGDTVLLILCAMVFGGIMERTGMLRALATVLLRLATTTGSLVVATLMTCVAMNILAADQYIAIVVPGRMFASTYRERGLHAKNLSRALEDSGTITSPLVPWNTCGAFMATTLDVATVAYLPFAFFNLLCPLISAGFGVTGLTIERTHHSDQAIATK